MDFGVIRSAKSCAHKNQMKFMKLTEHNAVLLSLLKWWPVCPRERESESHASVKPTQNFTHASLLQRD